jgi:hypothetical protein
MTGSDEQTTADRLAALADELAREHIEAMSERLFEASNGDHEAVFRAAEIVRSTSTGDGSSVNPEHLAFELLTSTYRRITGT